MMILSVLFGDNDKNPQDLNVVVSAKDETAIVRNGQFYIPFKDLKALTYSIEGVTPSQSVEWATSFDLPSFAIDHIKEGNLIVRYVIKLTCGTITHLLDLFVLVKGSSDNLPLLDNLIKNDLTSLVQKIQKQKKPDWLSIGTAVAVVGFLSVGTALSMADKKDDAIARSETPTQSQAQSPQNFEQLSLANGGSLPATAHADTKALPVSLQDPQDLLDTKTIKPSTAQILSPSDMTHENLQAHSTAITNEVRRQVLSEMGIDMDNLETLNNCDVN